MNFSISAVSLDVSLPISNGEELNAFGVESCECPEEYSGLSCQVNYRTTLRTSCYFFIF